MRKLLLFNCVVRNIDKYTKNYYQEKKSENAIINTIIIIID